MTEDRCDIKQLLEENDCVKICAPMVRYSKLEFRTLVRKNGCQLCFTPMILANSFVISEKARNNEFTTNKDDKPLIVQFAANNIDDFINATELVQPFCDGVDLNCGCPQRWAMKDGYGADLLFKPHLIHSMIRSVRNRTPNKFSVSVKIRILDDIKKSIDLVKHLEACGVTFITVHGRTPKQRNEPVDLSAIKSIVQSVNIPIICNGDIKQLEDGITMCQETGSKGMMCARGILQNPSIFLGTSKTSLSCLQDWLDICQINETFFQYFHHHLVFMLEKLLPRSKRKLFNVLDDRSSVIEFVKDNFNIRASTIIKNNYRKNNVFFKDLNLRDGNYFKSKLLNDNFEDFLEDSECFFN